MLLQHEVTQTQDTNKAEKVWLEGGPIQDILLLHWLVQHSCDFAHSTDSSEVL